MNALEEEWIRHTIMEDERRRCIFKVLKMDCKDAVPKGNNYISDIYRLTIKVRTNSGEIEERSAIYKILPVTGNKLAGVRELGFFTVEARMYTDTLPKMLKLLQSKEPGAEQFWPEFYCVKGNYDGLLMEDMSVSGYVMANPRKGFDFKQCAYALKNLAKFHALAAVLRERGDLRENDYFPNNFYIHNLKNLEKIQKKVIETFAKSIQTYWPSEWHGYIDGLNKLHDILLTTIVRLLEDKQNMFITLNHGDFWSNNLLFKYNSAGTPTKIRFLDFQFCYIHSPCLDIRHFLTSSLRLEFFDKEFELLKAYHGSLEKNLKSFGYKSPIPTLEELERNFEKTRPYGYAMSLIVRPAKMNPPLHELMELYSVTDFSEKYALFFRYGDKEFLKFLRHTLLQMRKYGLV